MRGTFSSTAWGRRARAAILGAVALALAGCATGYAFVQPDVAGGGGYYTSDAPYPGQGYPYYGAGGYGYYDGNGPYADPFGWYGGYGGYGYWPSFTLNLGIYNAWNFPGYRGPWYSMGWGCARRDCGHHGRHHHHHDHDPVASGSPRPWLKPDHPPVPPSSRREDQAVPAPARSMERFANRRPLPSARFAPHDFARGPTHRIGNPAGDMPVPAVAMPRVPVETEFANRRPLAAPARTGFQAPIPMVARPAPRMAPEPGFVDRRPMAMPARSDFRAPAAVSRPAPETRPASSGRAGTKVEIP